MAASSNSKIPLLMGATSDPMKANIFTLSTDYKEVMEEGFGWEDIVDHNPPQKTKFIFQCGVCSCFPRGQATIGCRHVHCGKCIIKLLESAGMGWQRNAQSADRFSRPSMLKMEQKAIASCETTASTKSDVLNLVGRKGIPKKCTTMKLQNAL